MTNTELLDLLREAVEYIDPLACQIDETDLLDRIDAALAERQDSATEEVEWERGLYAWDATIGNTCLHIKATWDKGALHEEQWNWRVERQGKCATEAEAKEAAIAVARGMK